MTYGEPGKGWNRCVLPEDQGRPLIRAALEASTSPTRPTPTARGQRGNPRSRHQGLRPQERGSHRHEGVRPHTVEYVKQRHAFGQPIGGFQAVQHRLAQCHQIARAMRFNALQAAWSGDPVRADMAATYAQMHCQKLVFDLHQFNGGIGKTTEHTLHYWTFRLRGDAARGGRGRRLGARPGGQAVGRGGLNVTVIGQGGLETGAQATSSLRSQARNVLTLNGGSRSAGVSKW